MNREDFIRECFELAEAKGFESCQLDFAEGRSLNLKAIEGELGSFDLSELQGVAFKGIFEGKMGRSSSEVVDETTAEFLVNKAADAATYIEDDDEVFIYRGDESYPELNLYNPELEAVPLSEKIDYVLELEKLCEKEEGITKLQTVSYSEDSSEGRLVNSLGLDISMKFNMASVVVGAMGEKDGKVYNDYHFEYSDDFYKLKNKKIEEKIADRVRRQFGAEQIPSGSYKAVLSPDAASSLLDAFCSMFSAQQVQKDLSLLKGKQGEVIAADIISIRDNPHLEECFGSHSFDTDGVATKNVLLVDKGVLKGYLHSLKTAKKDGVTSTGNAAGSGVAPSNIYIENGETSEETMLKEIGEGIYVRSFSGLHAGANAQSGDFSLMSEGAVIENGKIGVPFNQVVISGNILELLKDCIMVGDNLEFPDGSVGSPGLAIRELKLAGK